MFNDLEPISADDLREQMLTQRDDFVLVDADTLAEMAATETTEN